MQMKELLGIANRNFRKFTNDEHQKQIVAGNKTKLETISDKLKLCFNSDKPIIKHLPQEKTLTYTHEINGPSSNDNLESNIDFKGVLKNTTHEE